MKSVFKKKIIIISAVAVVIIAFIYFANRSLNSLTTDYIDTCLRKMANEEINDAVGKEIAASGDLYESLITVVKNSDGNPVYLKTKTANVNLFSARVVKKVEEGLNALNSNKEVSFAIGSLFGSDVLAGRGPKVRFKIMPVGRVNADFRSAFESCGINQTRHRIYLTVTANITVVMPSRRTDMVISREILLCDTVIVGTVPDSYVNVQNEDQMLNLIPVE